MPASGWGLMAAVMANKTDIDNFTSSFWLDRNYGLRHYLKSLANFAKLEDPSKSAEDILKVWKSVRKDFNRQKEVVSSRLKRLDGVYAALENIKAEEQCVKDLSVEIKAVKRVFF